VETLVYKYVTAERIDILENGLIRFTQPFALNDPFETMPNLREIEDYLRHRAQETVRRLVGRATPLQLTIAKFGFEHRMRRRLNDFHKDINEKYAFLSLSENRNLLMWSHYCGAHSGFVIGFDRSNPFFNYTSFNEFRALGKVKYSSKRPVMPAPDQDWFGIAEICLCTKSDCWSYEEELRMIANPRLADKVEVQNGTHEIYLFKFPHESLKEVILGYRMPPDIKLRIQEILETKYPQVQLFQAVFNETEFEMEIQPFRAKK
jgi:hypothetical protein